ncbi:magnesium/cobalt transporter CorA [soil metagenome]
MIVDAALYTDGKRREGPFELENAFEHCSDGNTFAWIGLYEPTEEEFEATRREFNLHELAVEDAIHAHQRPKLDEYGDTLFLVLKPTRYVDPIEIIELGEILLFVNPRFVVAVRHREASKLVEVRKSLEADPDELALGPSAVLLHILDRVVDDYGNVLEGLDADIEELESTVFSDTSSNPTERIYRLMREVLQFLAATAPLEEPLSRLSNRDFKAINPVLKKYFADVHDHLVKVIERISAYRDLLNSILQANLTQVSVRQNSDMRKISAYVAIAAVPTMLAGIWGMNFTHMPEIDETWGYPAVLTLMLVSCLVLYRRFKKSGWL